jgi:5'-3' exonuclease
MAVVDELRSTLEEMFISQVSIDGCESDDAIAHYCNISEDEYKTIFSSDKDLTQLISDKVEVYSPSHRKVYKNGDIHPSERHFNTTLQCFDI